jgi:hypothetical protein
MYVTNSSTSQALSGRNVWRIVTGYSKNAGSRMSNVCKIVNVEEFGHAREFLLDFVWVRSAGDSSNDGL